MFELWVPITIAAVILQTIRTALQKHLKSALTTSSVTFVRFLFGLPLAVLYLCGVLWATGEPVPPVSGEFLFLTFVGAVGQIVGTFLLVLLFSYRNFAVGTTYTKTEAIQTALFGLIFFGEAISLAGFAAILISVAGVMMISIVHGQANVRAFLTSWMQRVAVIGLISGAGFAVASVAIRGASLSLGLQGFILPAAFTLVFVTLIQAVLMGAYMLLREREQLIAIFRNARFSFLIGLTGVMGSIAWFNAMTLENAAYVRTLGQIELVFTLLTSYIVFRERSTRYELLGMALIVAGIVILLLYR
ncbi:MAG: DMT family transporter [Alphaproteobacteria bacterium]|nr:DMT family transporter [Alphaproteobacteria bacterium]